MRYYVVMDELFTRQKDFRVGLIDSPLLDDKTLAWTKLNAFAGDSPMWLEWFFSSLD